MKRSESKQRRLRAIQRLLWDHPEGLTQAQLARRVGVNRSTIHRDVSSLERLFGVFQDAEGRLHVSREAALVQVGLSLHEAVSLHMAVRMLAGCISPYVSQAPKAIIKIGEALDRLAPDIGQHLVRCAGMMDNQAFGVKQESMERLEQLILAWAERKKVRLWFEEKSDPITFSTYMVEPCVRGNHLQIFGMNDVSEKPVALELETIGRVVVLDESYQIPELMPVEELLDDPWGIPLGEDESAEVVLKFRPEVSALISNYQWHPRQVIEPQEDGSLVWRAVTAYPDEMVRWICGWGSFVVVLAPEEVREAVANNVNVLAEVYGGG